MSYAIIKTGGLQHRVTVGEKLNIGNIEAAEGDSESFDQVLAAGEGESVRIGAPFIQGATVAAKVLGQIKGEKVVAFKFRRRKGYHRTVGHRQRLTRVEITAINA